MPAFKRSQLTVITIAGIELMHSLYKGQLVLDQSHLQGQVAFLVLDAALAA